MNLSIEHFSDFFSAVYGVEPFTWQCRLLQQVMTNRQFPSVIDVPTACGKTAIVDVAVFALALSAGDPQRFVPRRVCLVVDRRIVVDQTHERAQKLAAALNSPVNPTLAAIALALKSYGGDQALRATFLRGATFTDQDWTENLLQPMVMSTTVDQIGSRMLFRGYGVGAGARPIHAALFTNDALVILDEAHLSAPFLQTLNSVKFFRDNSRSAHPLPRPLSSATDTSDTNGSGGASRSAKGPGDTNGSGGASRSARTAAIPQAAVGGPFAVVSMSATPGRPADFALCEEDFVQSGNSEIYRRLATPRLAALHTVKTRSELPSRALQLLAQSQAANPDVQCVGIVLNRVQSARDVFSAVRAFTFSNGAKAQAVLLTGRARPVERDRQVRSILDDVRAGRERSRRPAGPLVVVATQCVEAGADFDFDYLVTEAAPLDALRQRLGRLNRLGHLPSADVDIVGIQDELSVRVDDPVYGAANRNTWRFLQDVAKEAPEEWQSPDEHARQGAHPGSSPSQREAAAILGMPSPPTHARRPLLGTSKPPRASDGPAPRFNVSTLRLREILNAERQETLAELNSPRRAAPALFPAVLDLFAQTQPEPAATPDLEPFLHGIGANNADISFVWRADLPNDVSATHYVRLVQRQLDVCRPSVGEALQVPIYAARQWLTSPSSSNVFCTAEEFGVGETNGRSSKRSAVPNSKNSAASVVGIAQQRHSSDGQDADSEEEDTSGSESLGEHDSLDTSDRAGHKRTFWIYRNAEVSAAPVDELRPGDVVLLPSAVGGCDEFGWNPESTAPVTDLGDEACWLDRRKPLLRLSRDVHPRFPANLPVPRPVYDADENQWTNPTTRELRDFLEAIAKDAPVAAANPDSEHEESDESASAAAEPNVLCEVARQILQGPLFSEVTSDVRSMAATSKARGAFVARNLPHARCIALLAPRRASTGLPRSLDSLEFDHDDSFVSNGWVTLEAHSRGVENAARASLQKVHLAPEVADAVAMAALHHDLGKADRRFQHMLLAASADSLDAPPRTLLAKSKGKSAKTDAPAAPIYPPRTRHELISAALLEESQVLLPHPQRDLLLHLVAAHHGWARPCGPETSDSRRTSIEATCGSERLRIFSDRHETPVGCAVTRRFCDAQRQFGWWGLAFLESLVRNADHVRSRQESQANSEAEPSTEDA